MSEASARSRIWGHGSPWLRRLGATPEERVVRAATAFLVVLGLWLRARGFLWDASAFWVDEAQWAILLMEEPLVDLLIRPPGFMAVSKLIALTIGPSEMALRTLPFIAAVAGVSFAPALARRLFLASPARLLFVGIIALHPCATSFAKEFKPYEVSLTLHLALVLLTLRYVETQRARDLAWTLGVAFFGGPFAQDLVFAYPGVFLVVGYEAFRHRRRHLLAIVPSAVSIVTVLALQYVFIWSRLTSEDSEFWAEKYRVFHTGSAQTYLGWLLERYQGTAAFPGFQMKFWDAPWLSDSGWIAMQGVAIAVWVVLHVVGLYTVFRDRRYRAALLVVLPIGLVWLFNLAGLWPFGVFRANLFLIAYFGAIAAMAVDRPRTRWRAVTSLIPAAVLVVIPLLWFEKGWGNNKRALTYISRFPETFVWLAEQRHESSGQQLLLVDRKSCDPWRYYLRYNAKTSHLRPKLARLYRMKCVEDDARLETVIATALKSDVRPIWVLFNLRGLTRPIIRSLRREAEFVARTTAYSHTAIALGGPPPPKKDAGTVDEPPADERGGDRLW